MGLLPCRVHLSLALIFSCLTTSCSSSTSSDASTTTEHSVAAGNNGTSSSPHLSAVSTFFRRGGGINVDDHAGRGRERLRWHEKKQAEGAVVAAEGPGGSTEAESPGQNGERR